MTILSVNAGSSSIKVGIFSVNSQHDQIDKIAEARVNNIGKASAMLYILEPSEPETSKPLGDTAEAATTALLDWLAARLAGQSLAGIGHRIVQGGPHALASKPVTDSLLAQIEKFSAYDPEHAAAALYLIAACTRRFPDTPQVACFDAAFFCDMPRVAQLLPLPRKYEAQGVRRYGFHGLSYSYLLSTLEKAHGRDVARGRVIFAHLGSGASLTATYKGQPVDTTMGFTPASGVMMSSRPGDLDPGVAWYLQKEAGVGPEAFNRMVNHESGLLGVSGLSADMYTLLQHETSNEHAAEAIHLFCYQVKKAIGALSAALGGLDTLVFSGGIGEQSAVLRARICDDLGYLGVDLDDDKNTTNAVLVSTPNARVSTYVIPTDENMVIAREVLQVRKTYPSDIKDKG